MKTCSFNRAEYLENAVKMAIMETIAETFPGQKVNYLNEEEIKLYLEKINANDSKFYLFMIRVADLFLEFKERDEILKMMIENRKKILENKNKETL